MRRIILLVIALGAAGLPARAGSAFVDGGRPRPQPARDAVSAPAEAPTWRPGATPTDPGPASPPSRPDADPPRDDEDGPHPVGFAAPGGGIGAGPADSRAARPPNRPSSPPASPRPARRPPIRC